MTLLCCFTGASAVTVSLRHLYVRADELSLPTSEEGVKMGGGGRETQTASTQREKERERRDGCCLLWHTHTLAHHWAAAAAGRREHPSLILFRKTRPPFLLSELLKISPGSTLFNTIRGWDTAEERGQQEPSVEAEGSFSTRDSDHGSNGGGGVSARWVQNPFQYLHTSSLNCCSQPHLCCLHLCWAAWFFNCFLFFFNFFCICGLLILEICWK